MDTAALRSQVEAESARRMGNSVADIHIAAPGIVEEGLKGGIYCVRLCLVVSSNKLKQRKRNDMLYVTLLYM
jgi:hypothetical protein